MAIAPTLTTPLGAPNLLSLVLSDATFAQQGYRWGQSGTVWYCVCNPNKVRFEAWKKRINGLTFLVPLLALITALLTGQGWGVPLATALLAHPLLIHKHYTESARAQTAAVFTNGPQMRLPGNMGFGTVALLSAAVTFGIVGAGALIGGILGTFTIPLLGTVAGAKFGTLMGALNAPAALGLLLFLLGLGSTPFGSVLGTGFTKTVTQPHTFSFHFERGGTSFPAYAIGALNPTRRPGVGGLIGMVFNNRTASLIPSTVGTLYSDLVADPREVVVWGLLPINLKADPILREAIGSQAANYGQQAPNTGLILVAGSESWTRADTAAMIAQGVTDAVATDASQSAIMGSGRELVIGSESIFNLGSYRDHIQKYGLMMVPE